MASAKTQPARGMRDFLPADVRKREYVIGVIKEVYERYGFEPLETPAVENIETLMGKYGEEGGKLIFKILKRGAHEKTGEADLALRYDLTVPLARVVAQYQNELPKFFKRYQIQPVWRAERNQKGRFREFYQCDVDVVGSNSMVVEAELIAAASDALVALGFTEFTIHLNHRDVLEKIMRVQGVNPAELQDAFAIWDKLDKLGVAAARKEWEAREIYVGAYDDLIALLYRDLGELQTELGKGDNDAWNDEMLQRLPLAMGSSEEAHGHLGLKDLTQILKYTSGSSANGKIRLDPNLARGLSYYTGAIMEIRIEGMPSLGGGGRYDNLVGTFLGKDVPACGFSLGLERILVLMEDLKKFEALAKSGQLTLDSADVMVTVWDEDSIPHALALARELRASQLRVLFYPEVRKPSKQLFYARNRQIRSVIIVGPNEVQSGNFKVKDNQKGEEVLPREQIGATLRKWIDEDAEAFGKRRADFVALLERSNI